MEALLCETKKLTQLQTPITLSRFPLQREINVLAHLYRQLHALNFEKTMVYGVSNFSHLEKKGNVVDERRPRAEHRLVGADKSVLDLLEEMKLAAELDKRNESIEEQHRKCKKTARKRFELLFG